MESIFKEQASKNEGIYPIQISFVSAFGASPEPFSIIISSDSVWVDGKTGSDTANMVVLAADTEFPNLLRNFSKEDLAVDKHFYHPYAVDGGTTSITSKFGVKKFTNVFYFGDIENIKPDTIGILKFKPLVQYVGKFINGAM